MSILNQLFFDVVHLELEFIFTRLILHRALETIIVKQQATIQKLEQEVVALRYKYFLLNRHYSAQRLTPSVGPTFPLFLMLPVELRLNIWKLTCTVSRTFLVNTVTRTVIRALKIYRIQGKWLSQSIPPIIHACRESRVEGLKVYKMLREVSKTIKLNIGYFNFSADILWINNYRNLGVMNRIFHKYMSLSSDHFPRLIFSLNQENNRWSPNGMGPSVVYSDFGGGMITLTFSRNTSKLAMQAQEIILVGDTGRVLPKMHSMPVLVNTYKQIMNFTVGTLCEECIIQRLKSWLLVHHLRNMSEVLLDMDLWSLSQNSELEDYIDIFERDVNPNFREETHLPEIKIMRILEDGNIGA